jgi:Spy/CpxP family protein refolding chaperone
MTRPVALLAMGALFLTGVLAGVLGTHAFYAWHVHRPGGLADLGIRLLGNSLDRQLDLTSEQERKVDAILGDTRLEILQMRHENVPRLYAIRDRAFDRIHGVLTPAQQERLRRFRARYQRNVERLVGDW